MSVTLQGASQNKWKRSSQQLNWNYKLYDCHVMCPIKRFYGSVPRFRVANVTPRNVAGKHCGVKAIVRLAGA